VTKKPFFREFDGCWYAQLRLGTKRRQVKLRDEHREPIRGRENEEAAWKAFHRLMAEDPTTVPEPSALKVAQVCDLFLGAICPYADEPPTKQPKPHEIQPPLKPNAAYDERTYWWYRKYLQSFCDLFGSIGALSVKPFHVSRWLDAHPKWTTSRRCAVICVKRAYNWAEAEGVLQTNPMKRVKKPAAVRRERILSPEERQQVLSAIKDQEFRDFVFALQETGCRPGEVRGVTAENVNLELGIWVLPHHKTRKKTGLPRVVYLTPGMIELCRQLVAKWPEGPIFRGPKRKGSRPFSRNAVRCRFRRLREKLKLSGIVSYTYRHSDITDALERGVSAATVAELAGHKDLTMIQTHYAHLSEKRQHLIDAARRAAGYGEGPQAAAEPARPARKRGTPPPAPR
jgi:integrase